jgi:hypothetical protein
LAKGRYARARERACFETISKADFAIAGRRVIAGGHLVSKKRKEKTIVTAAVASGSNCHNLRHSRRSFSLGTFGGHRPGASARLVTNHWAVRVVILPEMP